MISTVIKRALVWLMITGASVPVVRTPGPGDIESAFQFGNLLSCFFSLFYFGLSLVYHQLLCWSQASNQAGRSISLFLSLFFCFLGSGGPQRSCWPRVHGIGADRHHRQHRLWGARASILRRSKSCLHNTPIQSPGSVESIGRTRAQRAHQYGRRSQSPWRRRWRRRWRHPYQASDRPCNHILKATGWPRDGRGTVTGR